MFGGVDDAISIINDRFNNRQAETNLQLQGQRFFIDIRAICEWGEVVAVLYSCDLSTLDPLTHRLWER